ncbi:MAG: tetratricopeptide repeat protein [Pseudomonadota bacterium]
MNKKDTFRPLFNTTLALSVVFLLGACSSTGTTDGTQDVTSSGQISATQKASNVSARLDSAVADAVKRAENAQDPQEAIQIYEEILTLRPNDTDMLTKYARALRNDGQLQKAKSVLEPLVSGDNKDPQAITELAMVHLSAGEFKDAELRARETITMLPENGRAFLALGTALDAQKYHEQAETAFRRGIEYWRGDPAPILNNLALNLASQGKLDEAVGVLQRARETSPNRMEIERNYRIISTLRETTGPTAPKPNTKPQAPEPKVEVKKETSKKKHARPQPVLENDPALKDQAEEETKEETENRAPVQLGPRTIQSWKNN